MEHNQPHTQTIEERFQLVYPHKDAKKQKDACGYMRIRLPLHPMAAQGMVLEHRAVMEQHIGRFLYPCEVVHHIDKDRLNNSIENLRLFASQRDHLMSEHKNSRQNEPELVAKVLAAAQDPKMSFADLPCAFQTARKILKAHGVQWKSAANVQGLTEERLIEAMKTMSKKELPAYFGCCYETIWHRFPHILVKRMKPGFLDKHRDQICGLILQNHTFGHIASLYKTSVTQVTSNLLRWSTNGELPTAVAKNVNARPKCKMRL
jgi:hypothetical protein